MKKANKNELVKKYAEINAAFNALKIEREALNKALKDFEPGTYGELVLNFKKRKMPKMIIPARTDKIIDIRKKESA